MDDYKELNEILVRLFRSIMDVEEKAIITREFQDITKALRYGGNLDDRNEQPG